MLVTPKSRIDAESDKYVCAFQFELESKENTLLPTFITQYSSTNLFYITLRDGNRAAEKISDIPGAVLFTYEKNTPCCWKGITYSGYQCSYTQHVHKSLIHCGHPSFTYKCPTHCSKDFTHSGYQSFFDTTYPPPCRKDTHSGYQCFYVQNINHTAEKTLDILDTNILKWERNAVEVTFPCICMLTDR